MKISPDTNSINARWIVNPVAGICLWFGFWSILGFAFATQLYLNSSFFGASISWYQAVLWSMSDWMLWGALSLPVWWLASRVRFTKKIFKRAVTIHVAAGLFASFLYVLLRFCIAQFQFQGHALDIQFETAFLPLLLKTFPVNLLVYAVIVITCHGVYYYNAMHAKELNESRLEEHLQEARLMALQTQLNPHFLFNTLHAISALIYRNQSDADRMLILLSDLLRHALEHTDQPMLTLERELGFLDQYLEIEQLRFGDRLQVSKQMAPGIGQAKVPTLMLQPLVENAIRYAVEPYERPCEIEIRAIQRDGTLMISVTDGGPGLKHDGPFKIGVGLSNVQNRLKELYGARHAFTWHNRREGGFAVEVSIPYSDDPSPH